MIFVDSTIPMYLVDASHPHKDDARRLLERFVAERTRLVTDVEVFQEILRRSVAIDRRDAIKPSFVTLLSLVDEVYSINSETPNALKTSYSVNENSLPAMPFISPEWSATGSSEY